MTAGELLDCGLQNWPQPRLNGRPERVYTPGRQNDWPSGMHAMNGAQIPTTCTRRIESRLQN